MPLGSDHPTDPQLAAYCFGRLPAADHHQIHTHVQTCAQCQVFLNSSTPNELKRVLNSDPQFAVRAANPDAATNTNDPPLPPELQNHPRYRVLKYLGDGSMGNVYLAQHTMMDRKVAIKIIRASLLDNADAVGRFQSEVRTAAKLDHPNIVRAYDAEQLGATQMFVMEYVDGASLDVVVARKGPLPVVFACAYIRAAANGLQHAYEKGTVHRDIKPANLMLSRTGQIKLCDFGLAKIAREEHGSGMSTAFSMLMGTPDFLAPEQAENARAADIRADIYSLGCTMYYLLTGQPPFEAKSIVNLIMKHFEEPPKPVSRFRMDVPEPVVQLILKMMAKDKNDRPQTPKQIADALAPFARDSVVLEGIPVNPAEPGAEKPATEKPVPKAKNVKVVTGPPTRKPAASIAASLESALGIATRLPERLGMRRRKKPVVVEESSVDTAMPAQLSDAESATEQETRKRKSSERLRKKSSEESMPEWLKYLIVAGGVGVVLIVLMIALTSSSPPPTKSNPMNQVANVGDGANDTTPKAAPAVPTESVKLFNGRDLTGWTVVATKGAALQGTWTVEDGAIVGTNGFSYLTTERRDFADFHLRAEVMIEEGDTGLCFRSVEEIAKPADRLTGAYQVQMSLGEHPAARFGGLCGSSSNTEFRFLPPSVVLRDIAKKWVPVEVFADGEELRVVVDGKTTVQTRAFLPELRKGAIALELCAEQTRVRFRNLEVRPLARAASKPSSFAPLFNGTDLTDWVPGTPAGDWKFENGVLCTSVGSKAGRIRYTGGELRDFHLRWQMKNTGSLVQIEIRGEGDGIRDWGYLVVSNGKQGRLVDRHRKVNTQFSNLETLVTQQGEWYSWEIIALGSEIRVLVNDVEVLKYRDPGPQQIVFGQLGISCGGTMKGNVARPTEIRKLEARHLP